MEPDPKPSLEWTTYTLTRGLAGSRLQPNLSGETRLLFEAVFH
jgi:hypothetical protein